MKKTALSVIFLLVILLINPESAHTAKNFPKKNATAKSTAKKSRPLIPARVKYRQDKLGILLSFPSFQGIEAVNYSFTYDADKTTQGIAGTVRAENNPGSERELLFGTCSSGTCKYHSGISNATLTLSAKLVNGQTAKKIYRIKTYR